MVNITITLSNFQKLSLVGRDDKLLSVDAIQEPGEHLFGSKPDQMARLNPIFTPTEELLSAIKVIIEEHKPQPAGYPVPGLAAILLKKGDMTLVVADLSPNNLRSLIADFGMSAEMVDNLVRDLQYHNQGTPSVPRCLFHILCALLASIGRIGAEHQVFVEPFFLADFPEPLHTDLPSITSREDEKEQDKEDGKEDEEDQVDPTGVEAGPTGLTLAGLPNRQADDEDAEVTFAGTRAGPARGVAFAPPLFDRTRPTGGASSVTPRPLGQVSSLLYIACSSHVGSGGWSPLSRVSSGMLIPLFPVHCMRGGV